jgi:hypothetical protein
MHSAEIFFSCRFTVFSLEPSTHTMTTEFAFFPLDPASDVEARILAIEQVAETDISTSTWRIIGDGLLNDEEPSQKASNITKSLRLLILDHLPYPTWMISGGYLLRAFVPFLQTILGRQRCWKLSRNSLTSTKLKRATKINQYVIFLLSYRSRHR